jgi:hypothetical protein
MALKRKLIRQETYASRTIEARYMGPDLLCFVDGVELGSFYIDAQAAIDGGERYIEADLKAQRERTEKAARDPLRGGNS